MGPAKKSHDDVARSSRGILSSRVPLFNGGSAKSAGGGLAPRAARAPSRRRLRGGANRPRNLLDVGQDALELVEPVVADHDTPAFRRVLDADGGPERLGELGLEARDVRIVRLRPAL